MRAFVLIHRLSLLGSQIPQKRSVQARLKQACQGSTIGRLTTCPQVLGKTSAKLCTSSQEHTCAGTKMALSIIRLMRRLHTTHEAAHCCAPGRIKGTNSMHMWESLEEQALIPDATKTAASGSCCPEFPAAVSVHSAVPWHGSRLQIRLRGSPRSIRSGS